MWRINLPCSMISVILMVRIIIMKYISKTIITILSYYWFTIYCSMITDFEIFYSIHVKNLLPLLNFFQNFSTAAVTQPITSPSSNTKNIPPTFWSPSSLTEPELSSELSPLAAHPPPACSFFHHLFLSLCIIPSSFNLMMALLIWERRGDPYEIEITWNSN